MSRHLTIKVDCGDQHCHIGSKQKCRYLIHDTDTSICRLFTRSLKTDELGTVLRCDACLKAEHTDDTPRDERDLQS